MSRPASDSHCFLKTVRESNIMMRTATAVTAFPTNNSVNNYVRSSPYCGIQLILEAHRIIQDASLKIGTRTSHNELERGRRAHLRKCMEDLKRELTSIPPGTRLTTLVILRSAREQLHMNQIRNINLDRQLKRTIKEYEAAHERYRRLSIAVEKMRNRLRHVRRSGSEYSVATTNSDESVVNVMPAPSMKQPPQLPLAKRVSDDLDVYQNKRKKMLVVVKRVDSGYGSPEEKSATDAAIHLKVV